MQELPLRLLLHFLILCHGTSTLHTSRLFRKKGRLATHLGLVGSVVSVTLAPIQEVIMNFNYPLQPALQEMIGMNSIK